MPTYHYAGEDSGYYRVYYKKKNNNKTMLYCIQNDGSWGKDNYKLYTCSKDGEPCCELKHFPPAKEFDNLIYPASIEDQKDKSLEPKFKINDKVSFKNDYGVIFNGKNITQVEKRNGQYYYYYEPTETPWFPVKEKSLTLEC